MNINIREAKNLIELGINYDDFDMDIYHTSSWIEANRYLQDGEGYYILLENESNKMFLPFLKRSIQDSEYFDLITPYGYGAIALSKNVDESFILQAFLRLKQFLKEKQCVSMFLRLHPLLNKSLNQVEGYFSNGVTLSVDLSRDYKNIVNDYLSGHRYDLRKAEKAGIVVIDDSDFFYYDEFIEIYLETMNYLSASDFYFFDENYFLLLKEQLKDSLKLLVAKDGEQVIGASLFMLYRGIIQYHLSGTTLEGRKYQPSKMILDKMIQWGIDNHYQQLHLGGGVGSQKDSLYKFKKGFSADEYEFATVRMVVDQAKYVELCQVLGYDDESISDTTQFFPLYRKVV